MEDIQTVKRPFDDIIVDALNMACIMGDVERVKDLLRDPQIDPTSDNNLALALAIKHERREIVDLLLCDPRVSSEN